MGRCESSPGRDLLPLPGRPEPTMFQLRRHGQITAQEILAQPIQRLPLRRHLSHHHTPRSHRRAATLSLHALPSLTCTSRPLGHSAAKIQRGRIPCLANAQVRCRVLARLRSGDGPLGSNPTPSARPRGTGPDLDLSREAHVLASSLTAARCGQLPPSVPCPGWRSGRTIDSAVQSASYQGAAAEVVA